MTLMDDGTELPSKAYGWLRLMESYPSDGWDGAATLISAHENVVIQMEGELDDEHPGWHDDLKALLPDRVPSRRTRVPSSGS